ncbi:MAG: hypothetical protein FWJ92_12650 [Actinomycetes bacterium]|jgi:CBS domain-containing protein|nr:hypothetical protein [Acidimicrobiia bacterium]
MTSRADASTLRVVWTRGRGCRELAELLAGTDALRVQGDPVSVCVAERADILVTRRLQTSFDLIDLAVPVDVDTEAVGHVVAAVAGGPHSMLAAKVAHRLGEALGVPSSMVAAYPEGGDPGQARQVVDGISPEVPGLEYRTLAVSAVADLVADLPERSLLVFGAPGGSWFHRRLFGPGARLRAQADVGAVVVKSAPRRVFQVMGEPAFVAPMMQAGDALKLRDERVLAVADAGRLVGIVRRSRLLDTDPSTPVGQLMDEPVAVEQTDSIETAIALRPLFGTDPIPVVDSDGRLVGGLVLGEP